MNEKRVAFVGMSMQGKSFLAKSLCKGLTNQGHKTLVFDPLLYKWNCTWQAKSLNQLLVASKMKQHKNSHIFIDECGDIDCIGRGNQAKPFHYFATRSRHDGHSVYFVMQRGEQIEKTMRDQIDHLYLFQVDFEDAEIWAKRFNLPILKEATHLQKYHYFEAVKGQGAKICKLKI